MKHTGGLMTSKMQRMQVAFTAEGTTAALTLAREAGTGSTYVDDIRVVHKTVNNFQADGSFKQDFESVVQGLYPFVLGSAQGVTDPVTHLAQLNDPYTQKGYRGKVTDDVLEGNWSLKHHGRNTGIIYQTIPQNFRFEPGKVYTVTFEYQAATGAYQMVVGNGTQFTIGEYLAKTSETTPVTMTVTGAVNGQTWIGLYEDGSLSPDDNNNVGQNDISIDELVIVENTAVNEITLEKEEFYKGEVSAIVVNGDKDIAWTSVNPAVAVVDPEAMVIKGMAEGKTTITATYKDGTVKTFEITIKTGDSIEVPSDGLNSEANTEEAGGEASGERICICGYRWKIRYFLAFSVEWRHICSKSYQSCNSYCRFRRRN